MCSQYRGVNRFYPLYPLYPVHVVSVLSSLAPSKAYDTICQSAVRREIPSLLHLIINGFVRYAITATELCSREIDGNINYNNKLNNNNMLNYYFILTLIMFSIHLEDYNY